MIIIILKRSSGKSIPYELSVLTKQFGSVAREIKVIRRPLKIFPTIFSLVFNFKMPLLSEVVNVP
jgi:hypothetical protein